MKKYLISIQHLLVLMMLGLTGTTKAQFSHDDIRDGRHVFNFPLSLTQCNFDGTAISTPLIQVMERDWIFTVENIDGANYIIRVAQFTDGSDASTAQNLLTYQTATYADIYYKLSIAQYKSNAERLQKKGSFVVGASTTIMKIRPGNNKDGVNRIYSEFGNDFNIGLNAGLRLTPYRKTDFSVCIVAGIGFSSIKVTPQTTKNFITSEASQSTITINGGLVFEIQKFQISAFCGHDLMSGEMGTHWIYRNRPWIGLGFGYKVFNQTGKTDN